MAVVVIGALAPLLAGATHLDPDDANDARGPLDVESVRSFGVTRRPSWRVITFAKWTAKRVWDKGFVLVFLDTFGDDRLDYYALVRSNGSRMRARLFRDRRRKRDRDLGRLRAWRRGRRSVSVRVPFRRLRVGGNRPFYRWQVQTLFTGRRCRRACFDLVPDRGPVLEPLVEPGPSPTVSPTPSPSPTVTPTPSPSPTVTPTPSPSPTVTPTPSPSPTVAPTESPSTGP
ncbi:MAG: hypothetical protein ACRDJJ_11015 [Actinomycetota bacterium]